MNDVGMLQPDWLNVSRETLLRLDKFCKIVTKWSGAINLVSKADIINLWNRHLLDSAQIFELIPGEATTLCDLGSGGGFPGVVLAAMAAELRPELSITLVESDKRKSVFLSEAVRLLELNVVVINERIDDLKPQRSCVVSARALAPLSVLCGFAARHMNPAGTAIFPKGRAFEKEIAEARLSYTFEVAVKPSLMDPEACLLSLRDIQHV